MAGAGISGRSIYAEPWGRNGSIATIGPGSKWTLRRMYFSSCTAAAAL
jgi:hypothetical protein